MKSKHFEARTNQRAITRQMLDLAYEYGVVDQKDRTTLSKRRAQDLLQMLSCMEKSLKKIIDKGGIELVEVDGVLVTAYRFH